MGIIKGRYVALSLVFAILVATVCLPTNLVHADAVQNIAFTKLVDEPSYKKTLFVVTTDQTTYHILVGASITTAGNESLIQLNATLYNPENETVLVSAAIPDTLTDHPTNGGALAVVQAIHIHIPEWFVEDLVYIMLPVAILLAIIGQVFLILDDILKQSVAETLLNVGLNEILNEVPTVWASIPWVFRKLLITDSNNDDTGTHGLEVSDTYRLGSFDLYIPISAWDILNALSHGDYYIATAKNWWEIEQQEYYLQIFYWKVPLFTYYDAKWISSRVNRTAPSQPPSASFTWRPLQPVVGEQVVFTSTSYANSPGGYISNQTWSLGDNTSETSANFTHSYQASGNYTVILNVTDNNDLSDSVNATVSIQSAPIGHAQLRVIPEELSLEIQQGQNIASQFLVGETLNQSDLLGVNFTASDLSNTFGNQTISSGNVTFNMNDVTVAKGTYTNVTATFNAPVGSLIGWYSGNITAVSDNGGNETIFVDLLVYNSLVIVTNIKAPAWVYQDMRVVHDCANISVTVENFGDSPEDAWVTLYYNMTANNTIGAYPVHLEIGQSYTLTFIWNTVKVPCRTYTLIAVATTPTGSNTLSDGNITVRLIGDVNGDGRVDLKDIALAARAFGSTPTSPNWNPAADISGDGIVNMKDIALVARSFGQHYP